MKKKYMISSDVIEFDMNHLLELNYELFESIIGNPSHFIPEIEAIINNLLTTNKKLRLVNMPKEQNIQIRNIRSKFLNRLIVIDGIIRQASDVRPFLVRSRHECTSCGMLVTVDEKNTKKRKLRCTCGQGTFITNSEDYTDHQKIVLEESPDAIESSGSQPKRVSVILEDGLVDPRFDKRTIPGNRVQIIGILKQIDTNNNFQHKNKRDIYIEANNIISTERDSDEIIIEDADIEEFKKLAKHKGILEKFAESLAPSVFGHEQIKRAITLQLFGGVRKKKSDNTFTRGDIHILLCGEPGIAKSVLLKNAVHLIPKARFVSGKAASGAGLIGAAVKDELAGHWLIEAGSMVLANNSLMAMDEMEKMNEADRSMMHEALEQQSVSFSKAGVQATLSTKTSLLAAANPKYGRFRGDMILEDINLPPSLLSRFDCIFVMRDTISKQKDELIAEKILEEHCREEDLSVIPQEIFRKYLSYAKKINPKISIEVMNMLKDFYVQIRDMGKEKNVIQMGARQLEAMIRLSQAHARVRLSEVVEKEDAEVAIELLTDSLKQLGYRKEDNLFEVDILQKIPKSKKQKVELILELLKKNKNLGNTKVHYKDVEKLTEGMINTEEVWMLLKTLVNAGDLYEPKLGFFALID
jgi:replicative DNA helicase Mcm